MEKYYRFENHPEVFMVEYNVIKHTPTGVWIEYVGLKKFVKKDAKKRFACPTIEEAKESFIARKKRQIKILKAQLEIAEKALNEIFSLDESR